MSISKNRKIIYAVFMVALISLLFCILPAFGRFKKGTSLSDARVWSGNVASSYRSGSGTRNDPYIISSPEEFAYFAGNLENDTYDGKYFKIINDIVINDGYFYYENNTFVLLHMFRKKSNKTPKSELLKAHNEANDYKLRHGGK